MKKRIIISAAVPIFIFISLVVYMLLSPDKNGIINPLVRQVEERVFPLNKYSFDNLSKVKFVGNSIEIGEKIEDESYDFDLYKFYFYAQDPQDSKNLKKVSGLLTIPEKEGEYPVIVQFRGYVDQSIYSTGVGTIRSAQEYATAGFISLSPDFLGYGESDNPSELSIEERFQTYTTALSLLASLKNLNEAFVSSKINTSADIEKLGLWGHSNGGHIALSVLSITQKNIPTVIWAPVTKPFPYSILYFTDEFEDEGKALRKVVADFERDYDVFNFSPNRYSGRIVAPIQIHQGTADDAVPVEWSNEFVEKLDELEIENGYFVYPGADHNLLGGWDTAVTRSIEFYGEKLEL